MEMLWIAVEKLILPIIVALKNSRAGLTAIIIKGANRKYSIILSFNAKCIAAGSCVAFEAFEGLTLHCVGLATVASPIVRSTCDIDESTG